MKTIKIKSARQLRKLISEAAPPHAPSVRSAVAEATVHLHEAARNLYDAKAALSSPDVHRSMHRTSTKIDQLEEDVLSLIDELKGLSA